MVCGMWCIKLCIRSLMVRDRILNFDILNMYGKISGPVFLFFSVGLVIAELWPFFNVLLTFPL